MIDITIENYNLVQKMLKDSPKKINLVLSRAINRAATNARSNMSKEVRKEYAVKASDIKAAVSMTKATSSKPYAIVKAEGKKISLAKFKLSPGAPSPKNPPSAYRVQVKKAGGLKVVEGGFLANVNGGIGMFRRTGPGRLPITRLMGPSVPQMIGKKSVIEYIEAQAMAMLNQRVIHEAEQVLGAK